MIDIAIVEDQKEYSDVLIEYLHRFESEENVECNISVFGDGMNFVSDYRPVHDIILMDIEMPFMNGMDAAKRMRELDPNVSLIFVTHLAKFALSGYEVEAIGYLIKPVGYAPFSHLLKKIVRKKKFDVAKDYFIKTGDGYIKTDLNGITYVEVIDHFLIYHTTEGDYRAYGQISKVEETLPSSHFFRCGKSFVINLKYVKRITPQSVFIGDEEISVSRSKQKQLMKEYNRYMMETLHG